MSVQVLNGNQHKSNQLARKNPSKEASPIRRPKNQMQFTCPLCPRGKTYQGTAVSVAAHQREVHPWEGNSLLENLGRPLQKTRRSNRYGVCYVQSGLKPGDREMVVD